MPFTRTRSFLTRFNPSDALSDFVTVWREAGNARWAFFALAMLATSAVFWLVVREEHRIEPKPPEIIYINSWRADRSDAEIRASNIANQRRKDAEAAEQAQRDEEVRHIYKTIGRMSGMDVDKIEADARAEQAASARAEEARHEAFMRQYANGGQPAPRSSAP